MISLRYVSTPPILRLDQVVMAIRIYLASRHFFVCFRQEPRETQPSPSMDHSVVLQGTQPTEEISPQHHQRSQGPAFEACSAHTISPQPFFRVIDVHIPEEP